MLTIFEGARNSGKTYLANLASQDHNIPVYKFEFVNWFKTLSLEDSSESTHLFALGKEIQILQANRDGVLKPIILDRGFLTVLVWGVLSDRIPKEKAYLQLDNIIDSGLIENCKIYYIHGSNPSKESRNKDNWDFRESETKEKELYEELIAYLLEKTQTCTIESRCQNFSIYSFENKFNETSIIKDL